MPALPALPRHLRARAGCERLHRLRLVGPLAKQMVQPPLTLLAMQPQVVCLCRHSTGARGATTGPSPLCAIIYRRLPRMPALPTLPQRFKSRPFCHLPWSLFRVGILRQQPLPELPVLLAPHLEVLSRARLFLRTHPHGWTQHRPPVAARFYSPPSPSRSPSEPPLGPITSSGWWSDGSWRPE